MTTQSVATLTVHGDSLSSNTHCTWPLTQQQHSLHMATHSIATLTAHGHSLSSNTHCTCHSLSSDAHCTCHSLISNIHCIWPLSSNTHCTWPFTQQQDPLHIATHSAARLNAHGHSLSSNTHSTRPSCFTLLKQSSFDFHSDPGSSCTHFYPFSTSRGALQLSPWILHRCHHQLLNTVK